MSFKPGDFFIGVIDFFSVILPGAILTIYLLYTNMLTGMNISVLTDGSSVYWFMFGLASYFLGHLLFALSSHLDRFYDSYYGRNQFLFKCAESYKSTDFADEEKVPLSEEEKMDSSKKRHERITNLFKWASVSVAMDDPASASEINRLQADSKFFRSATGLIILVSILELITACMFSGRDQDLTQLGILSSPPAIFLTTLMLMLAAWRFMNLRRKAIELCYRYYIALRKRQQGGLGSDSSS